MIVQIHSENPQLMSLLRKNPDSFNGLQLRELKNGVAIGRILSPHDYHMVFQDTKYSFTGDRSSQIDYQSFCNPRVFLSMAGVFLRHLMMDKDTYLSQQIPWLGNLTQEEIDTSGYRTTIRIPNVYADGFNLSRGFVLAKYFSEITFERKFGCLHTLEVNSDSVFRAVNLASLAMMYLAATNDQPWFINRDIAQKYIRIAKNLSPIPYFVLYLFARRCLPKKELFETLREDLESATNLDVNLQWGNTQTQRINAVRQVLVDPDTGEIPEHSVVEIGCGEMDYPKVFMRNLPEGGSWTSFDLDDYSKIAAAIAKRNSDRHLTFIQGDPTTLGGMPETDGAMLAVEVIEHMPYEDAKRLMVGSINFFSPRRVVITTPNANFNQHYAIDGFRHDDHHFELTLDEFKAFVRLFCGELNHLYESEFFGIGDRVGEDHTSLGCILTRS
jgi:hypothetical protein